MKIFLSIFLGITLFWVQLNAQSDYKKYSYYVQKARTTANTDSAITYCKKGFACVKRHFLTDISLLTALYAVNGEKRKMYKLLKHLRLNGYTEGYLYFLEGNETIYDAYKKEKRWLRIMSSPVQIIDIEYVTNFASYLAEDQYIRGMGYKKSDFLKDSHWIDSINNERLKSYILESGFPNEKKTGMFSYYADILLIHIVSTSNTKDDWNNFYKPIMLKEAEIGNVPYNMIAFFDDRTNWLFNDTQSYGTLYSFGLPEEEMPTLLDPANLDKRRAEMGIPPFYIEAKYRKIKLPEGYVPIKSDYE